MLEKFFLPNMKSFEDFMNLGAVAPSSKRLVSKMIKPIDFENAGCIVELGSGTGVITKAILKEMPKDCVLISFEIREEFCKILEDIGDERLIIVNDSAEYIKTYLDAFGFDKADYIVSGLPLVSLSKEISQNIINSVLESLKEDGKFIQFQYSLTSRKEFKKIFKYVDLQFELFNLPPAFVYSCTL